MEKIELNLALLNELIEEYEMFEETFCSERDRQIFAMGTSVEYLKGDKPNMYRAELSYNYRTGNGHKLEEHIAGMRSTLEYADTNLTELRQECERVGHTVGAFGSGAFSNMKFMYNDSVKNEIVNCSNRIYNESRMLYQTLMEINSEIAPIVKEDFSSQIKSGRRQLDRIRDFMQAFIILAKRVMEKIAEIISRLQGHAETDTQENRGEDNVVKDETDEDVETSNGESLSKIQKQNIKLALERLGWSDAVLTDEFINELFACMEKYGITSNKQIVHFLSQISVECQNGYSMLEKYNGNSPEEYFVDRDFHRYNNLPNFPAVVGDGAKYRGAGLIHLTWKTTYNDFALAMNDPEILNQGCTYVSEKYEIESACWFWSIYKNIDAAIEECGVETVEDVTKKVNGGSNGLEQRTNNYNMIIDLFEMN